MLNLARVQKPVGNKKDCGYAKRHDYQNGHSERGVEDFNITHSDFKDSKKVFAKSIPFCKLYLVIMKKKLLSFIFLGSTSLLLSCSDDEAAMPVAPTPVATVSSSSVQAKPLSSPSSSSLQTPKSSAVKTSRDTTVKHVIDTVKAGSNIDYPDIDETEVFCWEQGCEKTVKPRSSSSKATAKSSSSHSAITIDQPENKAPTVNGTTMTDNRDNKTYNLMQIGGKLWMAQDLNYEGSTSECYNEDQNNCKTNGRLYTYNSAQKACPTGWRLPTREEAQAALDNASTPWQYSGRCKDGDCNFKGDMGFHWTSGTPQSSDKKYDENGGANGALIIVEKSPEYVKDKEDEDRLFFQVDQKAKRFSVRCVQD
jgi:uncharacterized protein (TIGR02145 family)